MNDFYFARSLLMDFPITYLDIISTVINTSLRVEECRYIAVISKIKLQVFAKTLDMSGEM